MTYRVMGIDPSLTGTGIATNTKLFSVGHAAPDRKKGEMPAELEKLTAKNPRRKKWLNWRLRSMQMERILEISNAILTLDKPDLVFIEHYTFGSKQGREEAGELGGYIRMGFHLHEIPYVEVSPGSVKKFATGKGTGVDKDKMLIAAERNLLLVADHPDPTNDMADAAWLHAMAQMFLCESSLEPTKYRVEVLEECRVIGVHP